MTDLLSFFTDRTPVMLELLENLVRHESPSHDKGYVDQLGSYLHHHLEKLGAVIEVHPRAAVGDIRLAKWNTNAAGTPILILVHLDTVWPVGTLANTMPLKHEEGKLYGAGVLDMKAGIAIALEAIRGLQDRGEFPERPIWMLLTTDEETGSEHSQDLILETARECGLCLVMEPAAENEGLKTSRKGIAKYWVTALGLASHAGNAPEAGINAIVELAHQMLALHNLNRLRQGTSVSVTQVEGGSAGNVIPARASCFVDVRFFYAEEAERVDAAIKGLQTALFGSRLEIRGGVVRYPMQRDETMIKTVEQAQQIAQRLGIPLGEAAVGGGSDGNLTAAAGIPTLDGLGGYGNGMHALHEHVLVRSLARRAALVAAILRDWQG